MTLTGNIGNNRLVGTFVVDNFFSGGGIDTFTGRTGDDKYFTSGRDIIVELAGEGTDTVTLNSNDGVRTYVLAANVENLSVLFAFTLVTGNNDDNKIDASVLSADITIDGGGGTDTILGSFGDTTFITDGGDVITDPDGTDTVQASVSFTLDTTLENLVLTGNAPLNGTGNSGNNSITGNSGTNVLNGGGGTDALTGGKGNDTYITDGGDTLTETVANGTDTVRSSVTHTLATNFENLVLTGAIAINGTGNAVANRLTGNTGANTLDGLTGVDILTGGAGKDSFVFSTALSAANADRIVDFTAIDDVIRLDDAVFTGLSTGKLSSTAFVRNLTGNAADASDRLIFETDTGNLFFDKDGTGATAKVLVAHLIANAALTNADFVVF